MYVINACATRPTSATARVLFHPSAFSQATSSVATAAICAANHLRVGSQLFVVVIVAGAFSVVVMSYPLISALAVREGAVEVRERRRADLIPPALHGAPPVGRSLLALRLRDPTAGGDARPLGPAVVLRALCPTRAGSWAVCHTSSNRASAAGGCQRQVLVSPVMALTTSSRRNRIFAGRGRPG